MIQSPLIYRLFEEIAANHITDKQVLLRKDIPL